MNFDLKEAWKNEETRKKIIGISIMSAVSAGLLYLVIFVLFPSEDEGEAELTEIPLTESEEVRQYNSKLDAMNSTEPKDTTYSDALNNFFEDKPIVGTDIYSEEDRKADSLQRVFEEQNKALSNNSYPSSPMPQTQAQPQQNRTYSNEHNAYVPQASAGSPQQAPTYQGEQTTAEQRRRARLESLKGGQFSVSNENVQSRTASQSVKAVIRGTQTKKMGESVTIKTTEDFSLKNQTIKANTYLYGKLNVSNARATINITSINNKGNIIPCNITVYGLDGLEGLPIQNSTIGTATEALEDEARTQVGGIYGKVGRVLGNMVDRDRDFKTTFLDNQKIILSVK